jgi:uncharacterized phage-like protein YoqJ
MIIAATGHRPPRLGGYSDALDIKLRKIAEDYLSEMQPSAVISGMAQGWDMAFAEATVLLDISLTCAIPFEGQANQWPTETQLRYANITTRARHVVHVNHGPYTHWKHMARDRWMVANSDQVAALYDGTPRGGTYETIAYAASLDKPIDHLWMAFQRALKED